MPPDQNNTPGRRFSLNPLRGFRRNPGPSNPQPNIAEPFPVYGASYSPPTQVFAGSYGGFPVAGSYGGFPVAGSYGGFPVTGSYGGFPVAGSYGGFPVAGSYGGFPVAGSYGGFPVAVSYGGFPVAGSYGGFPVAGSYGGFPVTGSYGGFPVAVSYGGFPTPAPVGGAQVSSISTNDIEKVYNLEHLNLASNITTTEQSSAAPMNPDPTPPTTMASPVAASSTDVTSNLANSTAAPINYPPTSSYAVQNIDQNALSQTNGFVASNVDQVAGANTEAGGWAAPPPQTTQPIIEDSSVTKNNIEKVDDHNPLGKNFGL